MTPGSGFIEDMGFALRALGLFEPVLIVAADLPLISPEIVDRVVVAYEKCGKEALSVRVEANIAPWQPDTVFTDAAARLCRLASTWCTLRIRTDPRKSIF